MADFVTLIFSKSQTFIGSIEVDASVSEHHKAESEITDSPVETGAAVSDHIRPKPITLTLEGVITNTPIPRGNTAPTSTDTTTQNSSSLYSDRVNTAYKDLIDLSKSGDVVTITTSLNTYENMAMTSLDIPRDPKTGQTLKFTATFREVRFVTNKVVEIRVETKVKKKDDKGKKPSKEDPNRSVLKTIVNAGKDVVDKVKTAFSGVPK